MDEDGEPSGEGELAPDDGIRERSVALRALRVLLLSASERHVSDVISSS